MIHDVFSTEFWFHKLLYPVSTVGLLFCLVITSSMLNEIDTDIHGEDFLKSLKLEGTINKPEYAMLHVNINLILYYSQLITNFLILMLIFVQCRPAGNENQRMARRIRKLVVQALTCISGLLNLCIIGEIVMLWRFLHDEKVLGLVEKVKVANGFYHWYHLLEIIFDARCFFWFMLSFVLVFLLFSALVSQTVLMIFYAYERSQGRVYRNSPQLRFYRHNMLDSRTIRPEVEKFLEESKAVYEVPDGCGEKDVEECMICLQEFSRKEGGEDNMVIVLKCGAIPESATVPTPATAMTERDQAHDTERGLVHSSNSGSREGSEHECDPNKTV